jgi:hypothetical protein
MKKEKQCIGSIEIFEWYDGIVLGLAHSGSSRFLVCLLAFDPNTKRKLYLLISLSQEQENKMRTLFKSQGPQAFDKQVLSEMLAQDAIIYLTTSEPEEGKIIVLVPATATQRIRLPALFFPLIDNAVTTDAISEWLGTSSP